MKAPIAGPPPGGRPGPGRPRPALDLSRLDPAALLEGRRSALERAGAASPPITRVIPVGRAIPLGGSLRVVWEFRLSEVAQIQAWLEEQTPHPLEGLPPAWADPDPEGRPGRLAAAWEAAGDWPVRSGSRRAAELLGTAEGRAFFLALALRRTYPDFGVAEALELLPRVTPAEWAGLRRVVYGITPREELAAELDPDPPAGRSSSDWCLAAYRAGTDAGGPATPELADWTVGQWRNFCAEGKAPELTAEFAETSKRVRAALAAATNGRAGDGL